MDAAPNAIASLRTSPDDAAAIRETIAAMKGLGKTLSRQLQKRGRRRKGEGALTFRDDKKLFQFEVELPRGADRKRRRRVVYGKTAEATRRKVAGLKARGGGALQSVNPIRIAEYATTWLATNELRLAPKTYQHYCWAWDKAAPIIGQTRLDRFGRRDVIAMLAALEDAGSPANTIRVVKTVMGIVIADAIADGQYTATNPFTLVKKALPKRKAEEGRALSVDDCRRFIAAARADQLEGAWLLGLTAGLRIGEILGLQWDDIVFDNAVVAVRRQAVEVKGVLQITDLKPADSLRLVPIGSIAIDALLRQRDRALIQNKPSVWTFPSSNPAMPISPGNARRRSFARIVKAVSKAILSLTTCGTR